MRSPKYLLHAVIEALGVFEEVWSCESGYVGCLKRLDHVTVERWRCLKWFDLATLSASSFIRLFFSVNT